MFIWFGQHLTINTWNTFIKRYAMACGVKWGKIGFWNEKWQIGRTHTLYQLCYRFHFLQLSIKFCLQWKLSVQTLVEHFPKFPTKLFSISKTFCLHQNIECIHFWALINMWQYVGWQCFRFVIRDLFLSWSGLDDFPDSNVKSSLESRFIPKKFGKRLLLYFALWINIYDSIMCLGNWKSIS